jgi:hypothetical protein
MQSEQTRLLLLAFLCLMLYRYLWPRRETFVYALRPLTIAMICGFVAYLLMIKNGLSNGTARIIAVFGVGLVIQILPKRTRHIPARVKRQAVTDYGTGDLHPKDSLRRGRQQ